MLSGAADYDVFGAVLASSGSSAGFGFTGEQQDAETGWTFLRARYLDPVLGRFSAVDTVIPNAPGTQGFNPYGYVAGNPVRWVDPTGHNAATWVAGGAFVGTAALVGLTMLGPQISSTLYKVACYISLQCGPLATVIDRATPCIVNCGGGSGGGDGGNGYDSRAFDQQFLPRPPAGHVGKHPDYEAGGRYYVPPKHADPDPGWAWGRDKNGNEGFVDADGKVWQWDKSKGRVGAPPEPAGGELEGLPQGAPRQWDYQTGKKNEHINIDPRTGNKVEKRGAEPVPAPTAEPPKPR